MAVCKLVLNKDPGKLGLLYLNLGALLNPSGNNLSETAGRGEFDCWSKSIELSEDNIPKVYNRINKYLGDTYDWSFLVDGKDYKEQLLTV